MNVIAVYGRLAAEGVRSFYARLDDNGKIIEVPLLYSDLLSYRSFQCTILAATGLMPWLSSCEHRTPDDADSCWRLEVKNSLEREALNEQQKSPAKPTGGSAMN